MGPSRKKKSQAGWRAYPRSRVWRRVDTGRQRFMGDRRPSRQLAGWDSAAGGSRGSAPLPQPCPPAIDRARPLFRASPGDVAEVATGPPAQLLVGRQPDDRVGVSQTAYQGGNHLRVCLTTSLPDRPRPHQGCRVLDLPKAARPMGAPPKGSHCGHQYHRPDPSADPHDSLPWFAGSSIESASAIRAGPLSSKVAANSSQSWQNRQCQSGLPRSRRRVNEEVQKPARPGRSRPLRRPICPSYCTSLQRHWGLTVQEPAQNWALFL